MHHWWWFSCYMVYHVCFLVLVTWKFDTHYFMSIRFYWEDLNDLHYKLLLPNHWHRVLEIGPWEIEKVFRVLDLMTSEASEASLECFDLVRVIRPGLISNVTPLRLWWWYSLVDLVSITSKYFLSETHACMVGEIQKTCNSLSMFWDCMKSIFDIGTKGEVA